MDILNIKNPPHNLAASPPHRPTASPPHRPTASPPHRLTASSPRYPNSVQMEYVSVLEPSTLDTLYKEEQQQSGKQGGSSSSGNITKFHESNPFCHPTII